MRSRRTKFKYPCVKQYSHKSRGFSIFSSSSPLLIIRLTLCTKNRQQNTVRKYLPPTNFSPLMQNNETIAAIRAVKSDFPIPLCKNYKKVSMYDAITEISFLLFPIIMNRKKIVLCRRRRRGGKLHVYTFTPIYKYCDKKIFSTAENVKSVINDRSNSTLMVTNHETCSTSYYEY